MTLQVSTQQLAVTRLKKMLEKANRQAAVSVSSGDVYFSNQSTRAKLDRFLRRDDQLWTHFSLKPETQTFLEKLLRKPETQRILLVERTDSESEREKKLRTRILSFQDFPEGPLQLLAKNISLKKLQAQQVLYNPMENTLTPEKIAENSDVSPLKNLSLVGFLEKFLSRIFEADQKESIQLIKLPDQKIVKLLSETVLPTPDENNPRCKKALRSQVMQYLDEIAMPGTMLLPELPDVQEPEKLNVEKLNVIA